MRALVTGGAGFVGSHLCEYLVQCGHQVAALDDLSTGRRRNVDALDDDASFSLQVGDILDADLVDRLVAENDLVFHLAAAVRCTPDRRSPAGEPADQSARNRNRVGSRGQAQPPILLASTSEVYGKNTADRLHEDSDRILGSAQLSRWTYAAAKGLDEAMTQAYVDAGRLWGVIFRLFNTVGPRQRGHYGMVVPSLIAQAIEGRPLTVYGDGNQTRCFSHVSDIVPAIAALAVCPGARGQAVNLGGGLEVSINDLAERIIAALGSRSEIVHVPYTEAYGPGYEDMRRRVPDNRKARALVGFVPRADIDLIIQSVAQSLNDDARQLSAVGGP